MITFRFSKINLAVDVGAAPTLPVSKTDGLLLSQSTISAARLFPSRQCLFHSHGVVSPTSVCVLFPRRHRSIPVVRKKMTMNTIQQSGAPPTRRHRKEVKMSKQTLREGPMGKETTGERIQTLSGSLSGKWSASLLFTLLL